MGVSIQSYIKLIKRYSIGSFILAVSCICCIVSAGIFIYSVRSSGEQSAGLPPTAHAAEVQDAHSGKTSNSGTAMVDVSGAVRSPGVITVTRTTRISDVIKKAGGLLPEADSAFFYRNYNLARYVQDQEKIYVPFASEIYSGIFEEKKRYLDYLTPASTVADPTQQHTSSENSASAVEKGKTSINKATPTELDALPGVGKATAQKIIDNRPYSSINELLEKKIVSTSVFNQITDLIAL